MVAQAPIADPQAYRGARATICRLINSYGTATLGAILGAFVSWLSIRSLTDDAFITLSAARNLAVHGQWAIVSDLTANTSTSPLNVLILGVIVWFTALFGAPAPLAALCVANVLAGGVIGSAAGSISRSTGQSAWTGVLATVLVLVNPFVLSSLGLEVLLIPAVLMVMTAAALQGRPFLFGLASGSAVLVRLDLALFVLVIAASAPALYRRWPTAVAAAAAVSLPWYALSWVLLGSLVPDTLVIKEGQAGAGLSFFNGPSLYFDRSWWGTAASFAPAAIGLSIAVGLLVAGMVSSVQRSRIPWPAVGLGAGAGVYYLAYTALDTVAYHWYYVTPIVSGGVAAVFLAGMMSRRMAVATTALIIVSTATSLAFDLGRVIPWVTPPIFGNWASAQQYEAIGREIGEIVGADPVASPGEVGTLAYYCNCTIVDEFTDRGIIIRDRIEPKLDEAGPVENFLIRANYANLNYNRRPVVPIYRIEYGPGPGDGSPWTWVVESADRGTTHFELIRNGQ